MSTLKAILENPPTMHGAHGGESWALAPASLRLLAGFLTEKSETLETGAGVSTVLFAAAGASHTCVCPALDEIERIQRYCRREGISTDRVEFVAEPSEQFLPKLDGTPLDLVLIDGSHSFPTVFIDWYYAARALKVAGKMVVDDIHIWTGRVLRDFLREEPDWRLTHEVTMQTAVFEKLAAADLPRNWTEQPYVARRSYTNPVARATRMTLDGDLRALARKGFRRVSRRPVDRR